jgi:transcriptional regulator with XRE-family HTH domain
MMQFGKNLRQRARELGLTDAEVAKRAGLNARRYGFYVTAEREPDLTTLLRIAQVLQISVDELLTKSEKRLRRKPLDREAPAPLCC